MLYTDKDGHRVDVGYYVEIQNFPEYAGKFYQITGFGDLGDMYDLAEVDAYDGETLTGATCQVEPWKVSII